MRKHGWELPYHPLQVVAVAVFLALGFAFYVFFAPFLGRKMFQYIAMGIYTPLIACVFGLYIWCAAADPADPGVFKSKKYLKVACSVKHNQDSKACGNSTSSLQDANASTLGGKSSVCTDGTPKNFSVATESKSIVSAQRSCLFLLFCPCMSICNCSCSSEESHGQQMSEDGMFYCSLCEVEVFKYSKHCRVCDKCVDRFDHHCRWLNNCIGKKNYRQFFTLMVSALILLILQWSTGILVLICCFLERKRFSVDVATKLGSSFSLVPFVIVIVMCTLLAMLATLPLVQLFFFHILLIKKGISTYDYIIALREQEQEQQGVGDQQSAQMSPASSLTGLSSASSFSTFHRAAWCTPPRLFLEDQFDVVPPDTGSVSSFGKRMAIEESVKKKNPPAVKISPWTLARLNAEDVSRAAAEARKKSKIIQPVLRREPSFGVEKDGSFGSSSGRRMIPRLDGNKRRSSKRVRLPAELPLEPLMNMSAPTVEKGFNTTSSSSLAPLQLEARSAFQTSQLMSSSAAIVASSPDSSIESPDINPFRVSSSGAEESVRLTGLPAFSMAPQKGFPLTRSTSDGYEPSGGEDSDRVPSRFVQRSSNWNNVLLGHDHDHDQRAVRLKEPSSMGIDRKF